MRFFILFILLAAPVLGREVVVVDNAELIKAIASARPGDEVVLREGEWRDVKIVFVGLGAPSAPITLRAEKAGKAILNSESLRKEVASEEPTRLSSIKARNWLVSVNENVDALGAGKNGTQGLLRESRQMIILVIGLSDDGARQIPSLKRDDCDVFSRYARLIRNSP